MINVYGASDDQVEVEDSTGRLTEEFTYSDRDQGDLVAFSDGTLLRIRYDAEGNWRITPAHRGTGFVRIDQTDGKDGYSDHAYIEDAAWVAHALAASA